MLGRSYNDPCEHHTTPLSSSNCDGMTVVGRFSLGVVLQQLDSPSISSVTSQLLLSCSCSYIAHLCLCMLVLAVSFIEFNQHIVAVLMCCVAMAGLVGRR